MKRINLLFLLALFGLFSCATKKTHELTNPKEAFIMNSSSTFKGYYYQGSDNDFHYFTSKWSFQKDHFFKIDKMYMDIPKIHLLGAGETRVDLFETDKSFASYGDGQTLYEVE